MPTSHADRVAAYRRAAEQQHERMQARTSASDGDGATRLDAALDLLSPQRLASLMAQLEGRPGRHAQLRDVVAHRLGERAAKEPARFEGWYCGDGLVWEQLASGTTHGDVVVALSAAARTLPPGRCVVLPVAVSPEEPHRGPVRK